MTRRKIAAARNHPTRRTMLIMSGRYRNSFVKRVPKLDKELGDRARPACNNWTQFLPVHALGDARASIADQMCDLLDGHPELHERQRSGAPHANPARRRTRGECHQRARLGGIKPSRTTLKLESRDEDLAKAVRSGGRRKGAGPKGRWP